MEDKLEIGMYCYNKTNRKLGIGEIINFQRNNNVNIRYKNDIELVSIGNVIASNNIIDLIEYDDVLKVIYQNKEYVCKVVNVLGNRGLQLTQEFSTTLGCVDIKSIVTKEQFESMSYKLGDDK